MRPASGLVLGGGCRSVPHGLLFRSRADVDNRTDMDNGTDIDNKHIEYVESRDEAYK